MYYKFLEYIENEILLNKTSKVLLAVSGGRDSMVMLRLFEMYGNEIGIAHFNHKTRNGGSDSDQNFVKEYALMKNIPFFTIDIDIKEEMKTGESNNFHDLAHKKRYEWFYSILEKEKYDFVATAHHQDDNIETVLYKLSRGAGVKGLLGISPKYDKVIRPMLNLTRAEIDDFVEDNTIVFVDDESNSSDDYDRNFIRHNIIPQFNRLNKNFNNRIRVSIDNINDFSEQFDFLLKNFSSQYIVENKDYKTISKEILKHPNSESLLFYILQEYGFNRTQTSDMVNSIASTGAIYYSDEYKLLNDRKDFIIKKNKASGINELSIGIGENSIPGLGVLKIEKVEKTEQIKFDNKVFYLDFDKIKFPLVLRNWKNGDRFKPYGLKGKSKKLKDYFVDKKLNRFAKDEVLLLVNTDEICVVLGYDVNYNYRIDSKTKAVLKIEFSTIALLRHC